MRKDFTGERLLRNGERVLLNGEGLLRNDELPLRNGARLLSDSKHLQLGAEAPWLSNDMP